MRRDVLRLTCYPVRHLQSVNRSGPTSEQLWRKVAILTSANARCCCCFFFRLFCFVLGFGPYLGHWIKDSGKCTRFTCPTTSHRTNVANFIHKQAQHLSSLALIPHPNAEHSVRSSLSCVHPNKNNNNKKWKAHGQHNKDRACVCVWRTQCNAFHFVPLTPAQNRPVSDMLSVLLTDSFCLLFHTNRATRRRDSTLGARCVPWPFDAHAYLSRCLYQIRERVIWIWCRLVDALEWTECTESSCLFWLLLCDGRRCHFTYADDMAYRYYKSFRLSLRTKAMHCLRGPHTSSACKTASNSLATTNWFSWESRVWAISKWGKSHVQAALQSRIDSSDVALIASCACVCLHYCREWTIQAIFVSKLQYFPNTCCMIFGLNYTLTIKAAADAIISISLKRIINLCGKVVATQLPYYGAQLSGEKCRAPHS